MDFPGPAFRLPPPSPASEAANGTRKERDERLARALGFFDPDLDPVNRVPRENERIREEQAAPQRGPAASPTKPVPTAQALRSPAPKGRPSGVQREVSPPPDDAEKGRLVQGLAGVDDDAAKAASKSDRDRAEAGDQKVTAPQGGKQKFNKKMAHLFEKRHRSK